MRLKVLLLVYFSYFAGFARSNTLLFIAPEPLRIRNDKLFIAPGHFGAREHMLLAAPEPPCARKHCYLFIGVPKHLLLVALEPNPLLEATFEITFEPKSGPFHAAPLERAFKCTGSYICNYDNEHNRRKSVAFRRVGENCISSLYLLDTLDVVVFL